MEDKNMVNQSVEIEVDMNGDPWISLREAERRTGIPKSTIHDWKNKNSDSLILNKNNQLGEFGFKKLLLFGQQKGIQKSVDLLISVMDAGVKVFLYGLAGYEVKPIIKTPSNLLEALKLAVVQQERIITLEHQAEKDKPMVEFFITIILLLINLRYKYG